MGHTVVVVATVAVAIREIYVKRCACGVLCVVTCAVAGLRKGKSTNGRGWGYRFSTTLWAGGTPIYESVVRDMADILGKIAPNVKTQNCLAT